MASFSGDSRLLATFHGGDEVTLWEVPSCRRLGRLRPPWPVNVQRFTLSDDGQRLWLLGTGHRVFEWNLSALRSELAKLGLDCGEEGK